MEAGYESVKRIKSHLARTKRQGVLSEVGGFGGLFALAKNAYDEPVLVSGTDGVGTKLKLAFLLDKHDTIGQDCVAMCVNDIICAGAEPLFFLDYIACGKNDPERIEQIVKGIADACEMAGCALIGGETAEMPGFYQDEEYDLAGFAVGVVEKNRILDGQAMKAGDSIVALPSTGVHSNGFSLVRKIFDLDHADKEKVRQRLNESVDVLGKSLGEALLEPTAIYVKPMLSFFERFSVRGAAHMTGGGFFENIPRMIPEEKGLVAEIDRTALRVLPLFDYIASVGNISDHDMFNTFNMGVGMAVILPKEEVSAALDLLRAFEIEAYEMGKLVIRTETHKDDAITWL